MTDKQTSKKESYTDRLIEYLQSKGTSDLENTIKLIREFSKEEAIKIKKQNEKEKNNFTWGKYKNKNIKEVFKLDESYCEWALKSNYLTDDKKQIITDLINQNA